MADCSCKQAEKPACCAACAAGKPCEKSAVEAVVENVKVEKTVAVLTGARAGEPLMGVAESRYDVVPCGSGCSGAGTPSAIRFERYANGAFEKLAETSLPRKLSKTYASKEGMQCLPWVRVQRDPERFNACLARAASIGPMDDPKNVFTWLHEYMASQDQEVFLVILLDTQLGVRGLSEIVRGARDGVEVPIPDVLRIVLVEGATSFIVVHNHPSGRNSNPSEADKELTKSIAAAGKSVNVELMDHVIICTKGYFSFAEHGLIK